MKRSDSTTPRVAQWPPPAPQVASAIFAATIQGRVTEEEIDAVDGLPPSQFPRELMIKLGFNPPPDPAPLEPTNTPQEDSVETAWAELKQGGYPKQDHDPGNGETFPVYPEDIFYNDEHPLSGMLPDNARPETWRELDSAFFNPSKARSIYTSLDPSPDWPPSDERIDAAVVAAIRAGTIAEKELAMMRQASTLEWPDDLWHDLGFKTPVDDLIPVTVRISVEGTYYRITHEYDTHPRDGEEHVCYSEIRVEIHGAGPEQDGDTLLHAATFTAQDGTLGQYSQPPSPPWRGTMDAVDCSSRIEREMRIHLECVSEVTLNSRGITIGGQTIPWDDINAHGSLDVYYALAAYWHGERIGGELMQALYQGDEKSTGPKRAIYAALLDEIDYLCAHLPTPEYDRSPAQALAAADDDPDVLLQLALSLPWDCARRITGPFELSQWLEANHPASPGKRVPISASDTPKTAPWPPDDLQILMAMRAAQMAGTFSQAYADRMDEGPPETWPPDLWEKLGFSPPVPKTVNSSASPTPSSPHLEHPSSNDEIMFGLVSPLPPEATKLDVREITRIAPDKWSPELREAVLPNWKDNQGKPLPTDIPMCDLKGELNYPMRILV